MTDRVADLRLFYARYVAAKAGARDPRIEQAFAAVPREPFAGPGPWSVLALGYWSPPSSPGNGYVSTPGDDPAFLYQDTLVALDAARGINIGEPSFHARCLDQLALLEGQAVVQVGAGAGYYTALLAHLVGPTGRVHAYEIDPALAERAARNLAHLPQVRVEARSGIAEDLPKVDRIYVNAGITQPSWAWLDALRPGGRLLFPLQPIRGLGGMLLVERPQQGAAWPARFVSRAVFIGCEGRQDEVLAQRLALAFSHNNADTVRSLRLDGEPDATCWCAGDDWWLSTRPSAAVEPAGTGR
jgi:protein-L-isoaspartate(D-aspartate) O-methyltransferase